MLRGATIQSVHHPNPAATLVMTLPIITTIITSVTRGRAELLLLAGMAGAAG